MRTAVVITSINPPDVAVGKFAEISKKNGWNFFLIGDRKGPVRFELDGCSLYTIDDQKKLNFLFAKSCPERHYARKNIGYLLAIAAGAERIYETDDDNIPYENFTVPEVEAIDGATVCAETGSINAYRFFSEDKIWPRGIPLNSIQDSFFRDYATATGSARVPVWQGLANENPDVDALYRLLFPLPVSFRERDPVVLPPRAWCPFNSQNTTWFPEAFPLLYLPSHCSFRMTDIWRSFVAQRILWENGWSLAFHEATVFQKRNDHDLMRDFRDEIPGYDANGLMLDLLEALPLKPGVENIFENMKTCYEALVGRGWVGEAELGLLADWTDDMRALGEAAQR